MIENGLSPEDLLGRKFGHHLNFCSMSGRNLTQRIDLGDEHQMVLELRTAHDPASAYGITGVVISVADLWASVWMWCRDGDRWAIRKVITIPAGIISTRPGCREGMPRATPTASPGNGCRFLIA